MRHPDDSLLVAYSAGTLSAAEDLLLATHLSRCAQCTAQATLLDEIGGSWLADNAGASDETEALSQMLDRLDEPAPPQPQPPPPLAPAFEGIGLPEPLRSTLARTGVQRWQTVLPGLVQQVTLPIRWRGAPVRITRVRGGFRVPKHTHRGRELNLVLAGGYRDQAGGFGPGDIAENDEDVTHELHIDPGEDCIILAVNEHPLVPVGIISSMVSALTGF